MAKPECVDLYCGLGGWTEAFLAEGYDCTGYDIEAHDYGSGGYRGRLVLRDIRSIHGSEFKDAAIIVGSSPCQEFSYRAMPWSRAKALPPPYLGVELASEAAGRHIPMVVENVRGAQDWVGKAIWSFGSFFLWGDVPALMPFATNARKQPGLSGVRSNGKGDGWFEGGAAKFGSKSLQRRQVSAMIAKIPFPLAQHIARTYYPRPMAVVNG
jgi:C-5 cytosine-specific DNA methylase